MKLTENWFFNSDLNDDMLDDNSNTYNQIVKGMKHLATYNNRRFNEKLEIHFGNHNNIIDCVKYLITKEKFCNCLLYSNDLSSSERCKIIHCLPSYELCQRIANDVKCKNAFIIRSGEKHFIITENSKNDITVGINFIRLQRRNRIISDYLCTIVIVLLITLLIYVYTVI